MKRCSNCKYFKENIYWMGGGDSFLCVHSSNKECKYPYELNKEENCLNHRRGIFTILEEMFMSLARYYWAGGLNEDLKKCPDCGKMLLDPFFKITTTITGPVWKSTKNAIYQCTKCEKTWSLKSESVLEKTS